MAASQSEDIAAIIAGIRDRVRARYPEGEAKVPGVALPDLLPVLHARDAAAAKVAAIGSVNPRPPGLVNNAIQSVKRTIARALGWFVRDQVEFNRAVLTAIDAVLESLNEANRNFAAVGQRLQSGDTGATGELADMRSHWAEWRTEWEKKLLQNEVYYLRSVAELQMAFEARMSATDTSYQEAMRRQHADFTASLAKTVDDVHQRFWTDLNRIRTEYESLIHRELRTVRQKAFASAAPAPSVIPQPAPPPDFDHARFAERFRGSEDSIRDRQRFYVPFFRDCNAVLDIGCGRGEFLDLMREAGVPARGIDLDAESVALCTAKGLDAAIADVFALPGHEPERSFDGIFAAQVVEHMTPAQVPQLVKMCASLLKPGGLLVLETPNPECLAIFATHFYLDPTHQRPLPPALLTFYFEEFGFGRVEVHRLSPASETLPAVKELPAGFRESFFGGLDYCIIGRRL